MQKFQYLPNDGECFGQRNMSSVEDLWPTQSLEMRPWTQNSLEWHSTHPTKASHTQLSLGTRSLASLLLGIVVTECDLCGALDVSTYHIPGAWVPAGVHAHTGRAEGTHGECGRGLHR